MRSSTDRERVDMDMNNLGRGARNNAYVPRMHLGFRGSRINPLVSTSSFVAIAVDSEKRERERESDHRGPILITRIVALVSTGSHSFESTLHCSLFFFFFKSLLSLASRFFLQAQKIERLEIR